MNDLMDAVIEQIQKDVDNGDMTAIEELLGNVSKKDLVAFLSEEKQAENG